MSEIGNDCARLRLDCVPDIGHIEEILVNILSRLPAKTVVACKSVAKDWLRLISEPHFPMLQLSCSMKKLTYIICPYPHFPMLQLSCSMKKLTYIICPYPDDSTIVTHVSLMEENGIISQNIPLFGFDYVHFPEMTCFLNGLICSVDEDVKSGDVNIRIFNPTTRDIVLLPKGSPAFLCPVVGVVFDPKDNKFKAFRFFTDSSEEEVTKYKCEVYASGSAAWRRISDGVEPPYPIPFNFRCPSYVSVAGTMYWFVWSDEEPWTPLQILSVDMNDQFTEIDLPTVMHKWSFLIELEGCLSVVHVDYPDFYGPGEHEDPNPYVEVYKLENNNWCLRAKSELDLTSVHSFNSVAARDNEIFFIIRLRDKSMCYIIFDLAETTWKTLYLDDSFEGYSPVAYPFAESLLKCSG